MRKGQSLLEGLSKNPRGSESTFRPSQVREVKVCGRAELLDCGELWAKELDPSF